MAQRSDASQRTDSDDPAVQRRAPFADNPEVGERGRRTRERILAAALEVFGEQGYESASVERITTLAGCSRAAFYQYFSGRSDVFAHLAREVAEELLDSTEGLAALTPDEAGLKELQRWVSRYSGIHDRYAPVLRAARAAVEIDTDAAAGYGDDGRRVVAEFRARATAWMPDHLPEPVIVLVLEALTRAFDDAATVRRADAAAVPVERFCDAVADLLHRTLFGPLPGVNARAEDPAPSGSSRPALAFSAQLAQALVQETVESGDAEETDTNGVAGLIEAGRDVFVSKGYRGTRIDDIVDRAGVSHGAFYLHFASKDDFARVVAIQAMRSVSGAFADFPDASSGDATLGEELRSWLRRYHASQRAEASMIRVWADAALNDPGLASDSAAALDWGRRRMEEFLAPRGFGDVEVEATVLVAVLGAFGASDTGEEGLEAAAHLIERGFLGRRT